MSPEDFESMLINKCNTVSRSKWQEAPPLTKTELSALRYAAGYVPFVLKRILKNKLAILDNHS